MGGKSERGGTEKGIVKNRGKKNKSVGRGRNAVEGGGGNNARGKRNAQG